jgi:hypothetical protein
MAALGQIQNESTHLYFRKIHMKYSLTYSIGIFVGLEEYAAIAETRALLGCCLIFTDFNLHFVDPHLKLHEPKKMSGTDLGH